MKSKLRQRLEDPARSGVYRASRPDAVAEALQDGKMDLAHVSLKEVKNKDKLLEVIARQLRFPEWFGGNWDALEDCLCDLSWRKGSGHVLLFEDFRMSDELGILIDILGACAEFWASRGRPFFAVFVDPEGGLSLPPLYRGT
jgi:hypothetical protein